jgi:hypothetical protein
MRRKLLRLGVVRKITQLRYCKKSLARRTLRTKKTRPERAPTLLEMADLFCNDNSRLWREAIGGGYVAEDVVEMRRRIDNIASPRYDFDYAFYMVYEDVAGMSNDPDFFKHYSDEPFMVLLPIQLTSFPMALVPKGFIMSVTVFHLIYAASLVLPYLISLKHYAVTNMVHIPFSFGAAVALRKQGVSKYWLWSAVGAVRIAAGDWMLQSKIWGL